MVNPFPQADTHLFGARFSDYTNAPTDDAGRPTWGGLRPELVFAYLEKAPSWDGSSWNWRQAESLPEPQRRAFAQARSAGSAVSQAALAAGAAVDVATELARQEYLAAAVIATGQFDPDGFDGKKRREMALRAGLSAPDVARLSTKSVNHAEVVDALRKPPTAPQQGRAQVSANLRRAFSTIPAEEAPKGHSGAGAAIGLGILGVGAVATAFIVRRVKR